MPIDMDAWLDRAQAALRSAFGPRLRFLGLQGGQGLTPDNLDERSQLLLRWASRAIREAAP